MLPSKGKTVYDHMLAAKDSSQPHYPWKDSVEWEVVQFLSGHGLSKASVDEFLKLCYVSHKFRCETTTLKLTLEYYR